MLLCVPMAITVQLALVTIACSRVLRVPLTTGWVWWTLVIALIAQEEGFVIERA